MTLLSSVTPLDLSINPFLSSNDYSHSPGAFHAHSDPLILSKTPLCPQAIPPVLMSAFYVHSDSLRPAVLPFCSLLSLFGPFSNPFMLFSCCLNCSTRVHTDVFLGCSLVAWHVLQVGVTCICMISTRRDWAETFGAKQSQQVSSGPSGVGASGPAPSSYLMAPHPGA